MEERPDHQLLTLLLTYKGRICWTALGFLTGLFVLWLGWLKALSFLLCVVVGYTVGRKADGEENYISKIKNYLFRQRLK